VVEGLVKEGFPDKITIDSRSKRNEEKNYVTIWRDSRNTEL
jgi:uncharacterized membrane protein